VILFRCFPWDADAPASVRGGALWFPRMLQGAGRHDNPFLYGCVYATAEALSAVVERLQGLRTTRLEETDLRSRGRPLALAAIELPDDAEVVDLDDPLVLTREDLRPSRVATNDRSLTQAHAAELFRRHAGAVGLRWWSTFESLWANVTLFDRAEPALSVEDVHPLAMGDDVVREAADFLGLPIFDLT
jgi:hypothetical protein